MDSQAKKLLGDAKSKFRVLENYGEYALDKLAEKLADGFSIEEVDSSTIEVKKGFSYYEITRGGTVYKI